jgi:hypothetical protein
MDGIARYIDKEIYSGMNNLQEFIARLAIGRIISNEASVKESLINNGFVRTFGLIDSEGMVDVCALAKDLKREIGRKEKIILDLPMFGKMTFEPSDVDVLYREITGEDMAEDEE